MRRYDLDWLRVLVFALLIIYHIGMFFVPWGWHIKNDITVEGIVWPMIFTSEWRLASLFLISGMGTRFALSKRSSGKYMWERITRLFIPLIVGMILIVPPQVYVERVAYRGYKASFLDFLMNDAFVGIYPSGNISWHHLWFLPYLLIFSLILTPVFIRLRDRPKMKFLEWQRTKLSTSSWWLFVYIIPLWFIEVFIEPFFPVTHALVDDWYTFILFLLIFFYGFNFISIGDAFWKALERFKVKALILGVVIFGLYFGIRQLEDGLLVHIVEALLKMLNLMSWLIVIFGFGAKYLNRPSKILSYCNTAVYPFYIFHQTVTVVLALWIYNADFPIFIKFIYLVVGTFLISWILYEIVKRIKFLRPLFGLK